MELLSVWGADESVRDAGRALESARDVVWMTSLSGTLLRRIPAGSHADQRAQSHYLLPLHSGRARTDTSHPRAELGRSDA